MKTLIQAEGVYKKFSNDIKYNLYHGFQDLIFRPQKNSPRYLKLRRNEFFALSDVSLSIDEGEILAIIGINGSGKTSLIRLLSGIYPCEYGHITSRKDIRITPIFALKSGMRPFFSGKENIYIQGSMYGLSKKEIDAKMSFIAEFSELGDMLDRPFGNYSSGMASRLAYAIAAATDPDLFIIDEALAVGDTSFKLKCFAHLKDFATQKGKAVLFITNRVSKLKKLATRVIVLHEGQITHESKDVKGAIDYYLKNCSSINDESKLEDALEWD